MLDRLRCRQTMPRDGASGCHRGQMSPRQDVRLPLKLIGYRCAIQKGAASLATVVCPASAIASPMRRPRPSKAAMVSGPDAPNRVTSISSVSAPLVICVHCCKWQWVRGKPQQRFNSRAFDCLEGFYIFRIGHSIREIGERRAGIGDRVRRSIVPLLTAGPGQQAAGIVLPAQFARLPDQMDPFADGAATVAAIWIVRPDCSASSIRLLAVRIWLSASLCDGQPLSITMASGPLPLESRVTGLRTGSASARMTRAASARRSNSSHQGVLRGSLHFSGLSPKISMVEMFRGPGAVG